MFSSSKPSSLPVIRLVVHFCERKFMVVVPCCATFREAKSEIVRVYRGISPSGASSGQCPVVTELLDFYGCSLFDEYEVGTLLQDHSEVYAFADGEEAKVPHQNLYRYYSPNTFPNYSWSSGSFNPGPQPGPFSQGIQPPLFNETSLSNSTPGFLNTSLSIRQHDATSQQPAQHSSMQETSSHGPHLSNSTPGFPNTSLSTSRQHDATSQQPSIPAQHSSIQETSSHGPHLEHSTLLESNASYEPPLVSRDSNCEPSNVTMSGTHLQHEPSSTASVLGGTEPSELSKNGELCVPTSVVASQDSEVPFLSEENATPADVVSETARNGHVVPGDSEAKNRKRPERNGDAEELPVQKRAKAVVRGVSRSSKTRTKSKHPMRTRERNRTVQVATTSVKRKLWSPVDNHLPTSATDSPVDNHLPTSATDSPATQRNLQPIQHQEPVSNKTEQPTDSCISTQVPTAPNVDASLSSELEMETQSCGENSTGNPGSSNVIQSDQKDATVTQIQVLDQVAPSSNENNTAQEMVEISTREGSQSASKSSSSSEDERKDLVNGASATEQVQDEEILSAERQEEMEAPGGEREPSKPESSSSTENEETDVATDLLRVPPRTVEKGKESNSTSTPKKEVEAQQKPQVPIPLEGRNKSSSTDEKVAPVARKTRHRATKTTLQTRKSNRTASATANLKMIQWKSVSKSKGSQIASSVTEDTNTKKNEVKGVEENTTAIDEHLTSDNAHLATASLPKSTVETGKKLNVSSNSEWNSGFELSMTAKETTNAASKPYPNVRKHPTSKAKSAPASKISPSLIPNTTAGATERGREEDLMESETFSDGVAMTAKETTNAASKPYPKVRKQPTSKAKSAPASKISPTKPRLISSTTSGATERGREEDLMESETFSDGVAMTAKETTNAASKSSPKVRKQPTSKAKSAPASKTSPTNPGREEDMMESETFSDRVTMTAKETTDAASKSSPKVRKQPTSKAKSAPASKTSPTNPGREEDMMESETFSDRVTMTAKETTDAASKSSPKVRKQPTSKAKSAPASKTSPTNPGREEDMMESETFSDRVTMTAKETTDAASKSSPKVRKQPTSKAKSAPASKTSPTNPGREEDMMESETFSDGVVKSSKKRESSVKAIVTEEEGDTSDGDCGRAVVKEGAYIFVTSSDWIDTDEDDETVKTTDAAVASTKPKTGRKKGPSSKSTTTVDAESSKETLMTASSESVSASKAPLAKAREKPRALKDTTSSDTSATRKRGKGAIGKFTDPSKSKNVPDSSSESEENEDEQKTVPRGTLKRRATRSPRKPASNRKNGAENSSFINDKAAMGGKVSPAKSREKSRKDSSSEYEDEQESVPSGTRKRRTNRTCRKLVASKREVHTENGSTITNKVALEDKVSPTKSREDFVDSSSESRESEEEQKMVPIEILQRRPITSPRKPASKREKGAENGSITNNVTVGGKAPPAKSREDFVDSSSKSKESKSEENAVPSETLKQGSIPQTPNAMKDTTSTGIPAVKKRGKRAMEQFADLSKSGATKIARKNYKKFLDSSSESEESEGKEKTVPDKTVKRRPIPLQTKSSRSSEESEGEASALVGKAEGHSNSSRTIEEDLAGNVSEEQKDDSLESETQMEVSFDATSSKFKETGAGKKTKLHVRADSSESRCSEEEVTKEEKSKSKPRAAKNGKSPVKAVISIISESELEVESSETSHCNTSILQGSLHIIPKELQTHNLCQGQGEVMKSEDSDEEGGGSSEEILAEESQEMAVVSETQLNQSEEIEGSEIDVTVVEETQDLPNPPAIEEREASPEIPIMNYTHVPVTFARADRHLQVPTTKTAFEEEGHLKQPSELQTTDGKIIAGRKRKRGRDDTSTKAIGETATDLGGNREKENTETALPIRSAHKLKRMKNLKSDSSADTDSSSSNVEPERTPVKSAREQKPNRKKKNIKSDISASSSSASVESQGDKTREKLSAKLVMSKEIDSEAVIQTGSRTTSDNNRPLPGDEEIRVRDLEDASIRTRKKRRHHRSGGGEGTASQSSVAPSNEIETQQQIGDAVEERSSQQSHSSSVAGKAGKKKTKLKSGVAELDSRTMKPKSVKEDYSTPSVNVGALSADDEDIVAGSSHSTHVETAPYNKATTNLKETITGKQNFSIKVRPVAIGSKQGSPLKSSLLKSPQKSPTMTPVKSGLATNIALTAANKPGSKSEFDVLLTNRRTASTTLATSKESSESSESSESEDSAPATVVPRQSSKKRSSLAALLDDGPKKEQSKVPRYSLLPSQRRFSSEASMRMFSLVPSTHPLKRKKLSSFSSGHLRKKNRPSSQPSELNLSILSQEEVEYSRSASQNLSGLLGDESLWDTSDLV